MTYWRLVPAAADDDDGHLEWTPRLASERPGDIWRPTRRNGKELIAILFASKLLRHRQLAKDTNTVIKCILQILDVNIINMNTRH